MEQKPTIGRIVHFIDEHQELMPAIVTGINSKSGILIHLTAMPCGKSPYPVNNVPESAEYGSRQIMSWEWPPRV